MYLYVFTAVHTTNQRSILCVFFQCKSFSGWSRCGSCAALEVLTFIRSEKERICCNPSTSTWIKVCCRPAEHENTTSWSSVGGPAVIVSCQTSKVLPHSFAPDILLPFIYFFFSFAGILAAAPLVTKFSSFPPTVCTEPRWWKSLEGKLHFLKCRKAQKIKKTKKTSKGNKVKFSVQMGRSRFVSVHDTDAPQSRFMWLKRRELSQKSQKTADAPFLITSHGVKRNLT